MTESPNALALYDGADRIVCPTCDAPPGTPCRQLDRTNGLINRQHPHLNRALDARSPRQWIVMLPDGGELLVTDYRDGGIVEVAPRIGPSSWGAPLQVRIAP